MKNHFNVQSQEFNLLKTKPLMVSCFTHFFLILWNTMAYGVALKFQPDRSILRSNLKNIFHFGSKVREYYVIMYNIVIHLVGLWSERKPPQIQSCPFSHAYN